MIKSIEESNDEQLTKNFKQAKMKKDINDILIEINSLKTIKYIVLYGLFRALAHTLFKVKIEDNYCLTSVNFRVIKNCIFQHLTFYDV